MTDRQVSVSREIDAPASEIFEVLTRPAMHPVIDGSGSVRGTVLGPDRLTGEGDRFGMRMRIGLPYPILNTVVEYEQDRLIAWRHYARHRWRYELEPLDDGRTRVTETFEWDKSIYPWLLELLDVPSRHVPSMERTLERLDEIVTARQT